LREAAATGAAGAWVAAAAGAQALKASSRMMKASRKRWVCMEILLSFWVLCVSIVSIALSPAGVLIPG
jgi:hypothetical protein